MHSTTAPTHHHECIPHVHLLVVYSYCHAQHHNDPYSRLCRNTHRQPLSLTTIPTTPQLTYDQWLMYPSMHCLLHPIPHRHTTLSLTYTFPAPFLHSLILSAHNLQPWYAHQTNYRNVLRATARTHRRLPHLVTTRTTRLSTTNLSGYNLAREYLPHFRSNHNHYAR